MTGRLRTWLATPIGPAGPGIRPVDVLAAAAVIAAVELNNATATGPGQHPLDAWAYLFAAVVGLPVLLRRRWPRGALVGCSLLLLLFYTFDQRNISPAPLLCLPLYDAAAAGFMVLAIIIPAIYMAIGLVLPRALISAFTSGGPTAGRPAAPTTAQRPASAAAVAAFTDRER